MTLLPLLVVAFQVPVSWFWSDEQATRAYSIGQVKQPYSAKFRTADYGEFVDIAKEGKRVFSFSTHKSTVFIVKDDKLYLAEFQYMASGCQVESLDLKTGKSLWKTPLKGLGPIAHSKYYNQVLMRFEGKTLVIYGKESAGQYREVLEPKSGKMLDNATFPH